MEKIYITKRINIHIIFIILEQLAFLIEILKGTVTKKEADNDQSDLLVELMNFRKHVISGKIQRKINQNTMFSKTYTIFVKSEKAFLMLLKAKCFQ